MLMLLYAVAVGSAVMDYRMDLSYCSEEQCSRKAISSPRANVASCKRQSGDGEMGKCKLATPRNVLSDGLRGGDRRISMRFADLRGPAAGRRNFWRWEQTNRSVWLTV